MVRQIFTKLISAILMVVGLYWLSGQSWQSPSVPTAKGKVTQKVTQLAISPHTELSFRQPAPERFSGKVVAVPSGDSLVVLTGKQQMRLRLCGVDAPELTQPQGKTAQAMLQKLLDGEVQFVPIRQQSQQTIAEVFVTQPAHATALIGKAKQAVQSDEAVQLVNQAMVQTGLACVYSRYVNECPQRQAIIAAQSIAQQKRQGIWASQSVLHPWSYRRQQVVQQIIHHPNPVNALSQFSPTYLQDGMQQTILALASWYGPALHGGMTANGEKFDQNALTAAHAWLPFNTRLKITNLENGKSVIVRINDHHPAQDGSTIDISKGAAQQIGSVQAGIVPVEMEILQGR